MILLDRLANRYGKRPSELLEGIGEMEALALDLAAAVAGSQQDREDHEQAVRDAQRGH